VEGGEALVACPGVVVAVLLQVTQEADHPLEGQIVEVELGDLGALVLRDISQQKPHRVAVAAHRRRPESFDGDQVVDEERVHEQPELSVAGHGLASDHAGSVNASKRRLASSSSPAVMVR